MKRGVDPCAHLARMISTYGRNSRADLDMSWAYYDETVIHENATPSQLVVGGCVAPRLAWEDFSRDWAAALEKERVSYFHAKDFYRWNEPFNWFTGNGERDYGRHNAFSNILADIICQHVEGAVAYESPISLKKGKLKVAYAHGVALALHDASKLKDEPQYVILARHPELSPWSILNYFQNVDWETRLAGCAIFDPKDVLPLQAADYLLHSANKSWGDTQAASHKRLAEGFRKRGKLFVAQLATTWNPDPAALKKLSV